MKTKMINIAVIGGGAAGLCSLRHLASKQSVNNPNVSFRAVAYEQSSKVGGTWVYTDQTGTDEWGHPIHSSMYKNLRTNLPKECMAFPDYSFPKSLSSFVSHTDVEDYLEDYATHFDLWKHIKLQRFVEHVKPLCAEDAPFGARWEITTVDTKSRKDKQKEIFDAVLICNGHYAQPQYPDIPGLETYEGHLSHSHDYREPSDYADKTVVVLGAGSSGQDIAVEVSKHARQVYLSHSKARLATFLPSNVEQKPSIKYFHPKVLEFQDGSALEIDSVILCTGYDYNFDFISSDVSLKIEDNRVTPLYKHFLHCRYPNLGFVGVPKTVVPLPLFDCQVRFFRSVLEGSCKLPSEPAMIDDAEGDYQAMLSQGLPHRYAHVLSNKQFDYYRSLVKISGIEHLPDEIENIYLACQVLRRSDIVHYRSNNFTLLGNGKFKINDGCSDS